MCEVIIKKQSFKKKNVFRFYCDLLYKLCINIATLVVLVTKLKGLWEMKFATMVAKPSVVLENMDKLKQRISGNIPVSVFVRRRAVLTKPNKYCIFET